MRLPPQFHTLRLRIPDSRLVRVPGHYRHEFASVPDSWSEARVGTASARYVEVAMLDPASERRHRENVSQIDAFMRMGNP